MHIQKRHTHILLASLSLSLGRLGLLQGRFTARKQHITLVREKQLCFDMFCGLCCCWLHSCREPINQSTFCVQFQSFLVFMSFVGQHLLFGSHWQHCRALSCRCVGKSRFVGLCTEDMPPRPGFCLFCDPFFAPFLETKGTGATGGHWNRWRLRMVRTCTWPSWRRSRRGSSDLKRVVSPLSLSDLALGYSRMRQGRSHP